MIKESCIEITIMILVAAYTELYTKKLPDNQYPVYSSQLLDYVLKS